ncbi:hypothetical protein HDU97_004853 [Phlyctochytrium planicorne]|nr:hypothetical protein HDU97_004853 [Phlyctochytrium planicorne]
MSPQASAAKKQPTGGKAPAKTSLKQAAAAALQKERDGKTSPPQKLKDTVEVVAPAAEDGAAEIAENESGELSPSGLPTAYYQQYSRTYYLNQQKAKQDQGYQGGRPGRRTSAMENPARERGFVQQGTGGSSVASASDHLSAAVDNLFRMVEKKVVVDTPAPRQLPQQPPQQLQQQQQQQQQGPNPLLPPRDRSSWTSTAIHSEVSRLYHMGAGPSPVPPMPNQMNRDLTYTAQPTTMERGRRRSLRGNVFGSLGRSRSLGKVEESSSRRSRSRAPTIADENAVKRMFLFGFLFFPCWFVGSLSAVSSKWRTFCRVASVLFLLIALAVAIYFIFFFRR